MAMSDIAAKHQIGQTLLNSIHAKQQKAAI